MKLWLNFIGYEIAWLIAVIAAAHAMVWPGVVAFVLFAVWQVTVSPQRKTELKLIVLAVLCGMALDGSLAASGLVHYALPFPSLPPGGAPLWILSLWGSFALIQTQSLRYFQGRLRLAALAGFIGGPLAYWGAGVAWNVVQFPAPSWRALAALAVGWAVATPLLAGMAGYWSVRNGHHAEVTHERV